MKTSKTAFNTLGYIAGLDTAVAHDGHSYVVMCNGSKMAQFQCESQTIMFLASIGGITYKRAVSMVLDVKSALHPRKGVGT